MITPFPDRSSPQMSWCHLYPYIIPKHWSPNTILVLYVLLSFFSLSLSLETLPLTLLGCTNYSRLIPTLSQWTQPHSVNLHYIRVFESPRCFLEKNFIMLNHRMRYQDVCTHPYWRIKIPGITSVFIFLRIKICWSVFGRQCYFKYIFIIFIVFSM